MIPHELEEQMVALGLEKARTKARSYLLEKEVKSVFAQQCIKARGDHSQGDSEKHALVSDIYKRSVRDAAEALEEYEVARVRHDAFIARFEAWRSLNSSKRAQIQQGVYQSGGESDG